MEFVCTNYNDLWGVWTELAGEKWNFSAEVCFPGSQIGTLVMLTCTFSLATRI